MWHETCKGNGLALGEKIFYIENAFVRKKEAYRKRVYVLYCFRNETVEQTKKKIKEKGRP